MEVKESLLVEEHVGRSHRRFIHVKRMARMCHACIGEASTSLVQCDDHIEGDRVYAGEAGLVLPRPLPHDTHRMELLRDWSSPCNSQFEKSCNFSETGGFIPL